MFIYIYRFWPPVIFWLLFTALSFPSCSCFMFEEKEPSHQFRWLNILVISLIKRVPSPWDSLCHPQKEPMSPIGLQHTSTQMLPVSERRIVRWLSCHVEEHCSGWNLMKFAKTNDTQLQSSKNEMDIILDCRVVASHQSTSEFYVNPQMALSERDNGRFDTCGLT